MPPDDEIAKMLAGDEGLKSACGINKRNRLTIGHSKSPIRRRIRLRPAVAARAGINRLILSGVRGLKRLLDVFARTRARICQPGAAQLLEGAAIERHALGLF